MAGVSSRWRSNGRRPRPFRAWLGPGSRRPGWGRCPRASSAFPPFSAPLSPSCPLPAAAEAERCGEYGVVWGRGWLAPGGEAAGGGGQPQPPRSCFPSISSSCPVLLGVGSQPRSSRGLWAAAAPRVGTWPVGVWARRRWEKAPKGSSAPAGCGGRAAPCWGRRPWVAASGVRRYYLWWMVAA